jgi:membrane protease YdiL (CAAX protease family)
MRIAERIIALLEILLVSGIATQSAAIVLLHSLGVGDPAGESTLKGLFLLTAVDTVFILLLVGLLQWKRGGLVEPFGLRLAKLPREAAIGFALGFPCFLTFVVGGDWFFRQFLPQLHTRENPILKMLTGDRDLAFLLATGIVAGAVREEFQRAFVLDRLQKLFPPGKPPVQSTYFTPGIWIGLTVWSLLFGLGHRMQGPDAVIVTFVAGFLLGCLFLWRRSVVAPMVCHGVANTAAILMAFFFPNLLQ